MASQSCWIVFESVQCDYDTVQLAEAIVDNLTQFMRGGMSTMLDFKSDTPRTIHLALFDWSSSLPIETVCCNVVESFEYGTASTHQPRGYKYQCRSC